MSEGPITDKMIEFADKHGLTKADVEDLRAGKVVVKNTEPED
jgi:hypothetical protein